MTLTLYCLWEGGSDFNFGNVDPTNVVAWNQTIQTALRNNSNTVHRLYELGARAILFQTQPGTNDLDLVFFDVYRAGLIDRYLKDFNAQFVTSMDSFSRTHHDVRLYFVDLYSLWDEISTHPDVFGFTHIARDALGDTSLTDKSFTGPGADYLLWNPSHPTSKFHKLLASRHVDTLANAVLERLEAKLATGSATIAMKHLLIGRDYTLQTSSDLANWNDVQTFTASAGTNRVTQALSAEAASVFYRLQWQP
jgi:phospholipase/lecithinase/hemolysin